MKNLELHGCGTAIITPFNTEGVDYDAYRILVQRQIDAGIDFLVPLGTTAEASCLCLEEEIKILEITREITADKTLVVGAGSNDTNTVIKNVQVFGPLGADAFLIVTPYYNKPTQEGLYRHFKAVAESTDKSIVLYNVPGRTGVNLTAEVTLRLAEIPNIIAVKEASSNYSQICEIIRHAPKGFSVLSGNDDEVFSLMASGAKGVISVAANIAPVEMVKLVNMLRDSSYDLARTLHYELWPLFKNCFIESNPIPTKAALSIMGLVGNVLRAPLYPATKQTMEAMTNTLRDLKLI